MRSICRVVDLLHTIFKDKRLLANLTLQDFKRRFAGSYLGTLWGFVNPLFTIIVYWLVFQYGFGRAPVNGFPFVLWFMCGMIPWLFFSEAFSSGCNSFLEYSYLVKKVVFNINILPLVKILSCMLTHFFFVALLAVICICFGYYPSVYWLQIPYYLLCATVLLFALTLALSSITVFFRDFNQLIGIILLVGMWGTPISWNIQNFSPNIQFVLKLNPIFYIVEGYRDCFLYQTWFWEKGSLTVYFWILAAIVLAVGTKIYDKLKYSFADFL